MGKAGRPRKSIDTRLKRLWGDSCISLPSLAERLGVCIRTVINHRQRLNLPLRKKGRGYKYDH